MTAAREAGMGPKPGAVAQAGRKLIETGDPDFPFVYEATPEEVETLKQLGL